MKSAYLWNTAGSMLNAFQSVIFLVILRRVCDLSVAGVFTLAYANANLFLNMGNYGKRNFQASDASRQYSFGAYARSRLITDLAMLLFSTAYLAYCAVTIGYPLWKSAAVLLMTLFKLVDSIEDVTDGNYQQNGRLDLGGRLLTFRLLFTICIFAITVILTRDLVVTLLVSTIFTLLFYVAGVHVIKRRYALPASAGDPPSVSPWPLLKECLPLFIAAFLLYYIGNAPKWAIDSVMDDSAQAIYGFIAMPVFVVGLLAQFIYMPLVEPLSVRWAEGEVRAFSREFIRQGAFIVGIVAVCDLLAWLLGVPVLNLLYNTDVSLYLTDLLVLVTGGGFLALAQLFTMGITIIRQQHKLTVGYVAVGIISFFASSFSVANWGIAGASWCYIGCMSVLALWFGVTFVRCVGRATQGE